MAFQEKNLAQARENTTNAVTVYSRPASTTSIIKTIIVCNQSGAAATYRLFYDDNGSTYDESTALVWDAPVPADGSIILNLFLAMATASGTIGYRSSVANAITISLFGSEIT